MTTSFIRPLGMNTNPKAAAVLVDRVFAEGREDQYKRELTTNSLQAGATVVHVTACRPFADGGVKAAFVDNGIGMASTKIGDYIGELFSGASVLGPDKNFQMGARVSTLPWNHAGVLVASWTEDEPEGTMIQLNYDEEAQEYGAVPFVDETDPDALPQLTGIPPAWLRHPIIEEAGHGTVVILMGNAPEDNTVGKMERTPDGRFRFDAGRAADPRENWHYYNSKYWELINAEGAGVKLFFLWTARDLRVWRALIDVESWPEPGRQLDECPGCERQQWHAGPRPLRHKLTLRRVRGLHPILDHFAAESRPDEKRIQRGSVPVVANGHRATVHWALTPTFMDSGDRGVDYSDTGDFGVRLPLFAELRCRELYAVKMGAADTRVPMEFYGITHPDLRSRLVLVVEPDPRPSARSYGAVPSSARDRLMIANGELPHREWGAEFAAHMPVEIRARLEALLGANDKGAEKRQRDLAKRLQQMFGRRLSRKPNPEGTSMDTKDSPFGDPRTVSRDRDREPANRPTRSRSDVGHRPGIAATPKASGLRTVGTRRSEPKGPITVAWDAAGELFVDRRGVMADFVESARLLRINGQHSVIRALIEDAQAIRHPAKADRIEELARAAIQDFYIGYVTAAEMYPMTNATQGESPADPAKFFAEATSDVAMTAAGVNVPVLSSLVNGKLRGYPGMRPLAQHAATPSGKAAEAEAAEVEEMTA